LCNQRQETDGGNVQMHFNMDLLVNGFFFKFDLFFSFNYIFDSNKITDNDLENVVRLTTDEDLSKKIVKDFYEISIEWDLNGIYNAIVTYFSNYIKRPEKINIKTFKWFNNNDLPEFYDVTILLDENQKLRAHKVILMMRIEYFKMMFHHCWSENSTVDLRQISINFMKPIIQFAYDNNVNALRSACKSENFIYNMIAICDQYLIENMKKIFERLICEKITLRNCAENLEFSDAYNCSVLKNYCMEFISLNLARLLEGNYLDNLDGAMLKELSLFYRKFFHFENDSNYVITPTFDAPTDEEIDQVVKGIIKYKFCELVNSFFVIKTRL
jgi:BTB/POZ domain